MGCMKRNICIIIGTLAGLTAFAQQRWTMDDCIAYAIEHSNDVRKQRMETAQSRYEEKTAKLDFLPTVSAQTSAQYNWGRNIDPGTNTYNNVTTFQNYYSIGAEVALFDGGRTLHAFKKARLARAAGETTLQKAADDKAMTVMAKFVEAVYQRQGIALAERKLADSRAMLRKTQALFEQGEKARPDVVQMESQVAEDDYNLLHLQNNALLAMAALKTEMNFPAGDSLALDTTLVATVVANDDAHAIYDRFKDVSPVVRTAADQVEKARRDYLISRAGLLPSLKLGGGISTNYYRNLSRDGGRAESFGKQFANNRGEYIYLSLSIPVFTPSNWRSVRRAKTDWEAARLDLDDARRKLNDDIAQAVLDRNGYARELVKMEKKAEADALAYRLSQRKYEEGMLSTFDLHTAAQAWLDSRIRLLQMKLMLEMKERLVNYYKGIRPWTLK